MASPQQNNTQSPTRRQRYNLISVTLTVGVLFLCVIDSDAAKNGFATHFNNIGAHLDKALSDVLQLGGPNYTDIMVNTSYDSGSVKFVPRGMAGLYNITGLFMKLILPDIFLPEGLKKHIEQQHFELRVIQERWLELVTGYAGILAISIIIIIMGGLMPICGVLFCCCRCCGKCGARSKPYDSKCDLCRKIMLATMLICCGTLLLFGVVCAFTSNQQMADGVQTLPKNLRTSAKDTSAFLNSTNHQISLLTNKNLKEFDAYIRKTLDSCSMIVFKELENISNATSMDEISEIADQFPKIRQDYQLLKDSTNELRVYASQLNDAVRKIRKDLLEILRGCVDKLDQCKKLNEDISRLQTNIDFNKLPDINAQIKELDDILLKTDISDISGGKRKLQNVQTEIQKAVKANIDEAKRKLAEAGKRLTKYSKDITRGIDDFTKQINTDSYIETGEKLINLYDPYRYYVGITASSILLLICVLIMLGLICGICGKRPDVYGEDCCNKGNGSQCLICAVIIMFFFTFVIASVTLIYFVLGVTTQKTVCETLRQPENNKILPILDKYGVLGDLNTSISDAIVKCHKNETLYNVFNLKTVFDLDKWDDHIAEFNINKTLENLSKTKVDFSGFTLLNATQIETLRRISQSEFADVAFEKFKDELNTNFTNTDFKDILEELHVLIRKVHEIALYDKNAIDLEDQLNSMNGHIKFYQEKIVQPMKETAFKVIETASSLEIKLKLGRDSFKSGMEDLIEKVDVAQNTLKYDGPQLIKTIARNFGNDVLKQVRKYLDRITVKAKTEVGTCGPLSAVFNATLISTCDKIVTPMNGYWFTLLCSLVLFIPTIIISVKLATLYQKQNPYSRHAVEAEYFYDAYTDRDQIPLNNSARGGKGKKKKKYKRGEERINLSSSEPLPRDFAGASQPSDARYADMAPKNWEEFPAGGPPQYQRAPTEYERPPPYYFPGETSQAT